MERIYRGTATLLLYSSKIMEHIVSKKKKHYESNTEPAQACRVSRSTDLVKQTISVLEKMTFLADKGNRVD